MGILNDPRDICDNVGEIVFGYHAQYGFQCRKRIIRDLRLSSRKDRKERRFSGIRETDQADIGDQFQFHQKFPFLTGSTRCSKLRGLPDGIGIVHISETALAASGNYDLLSGFRKVCDDIA